MKNKERDLLSDLTVLIIRMIRWGGVASLTVLKHIAIESPDNPRIQHEVSETYKKVRYMEREVVISRSEDHDSPTDPQHSAEYAPYLGDALD